MNETLKKNIIKYSIITVAGIILFAAGFGTGRGLRLSRTSGVSSDLESTIVSASDTASDLSDRLSTARAIANSAASSGRAVEEGLGVLEQSTERLELFYTEVVRAIEADKAATATFQQLYGESSGTTIDALDIAIQHSEQYEQLISSLQRACDDFAKDSSESE